MCMLTLRYEPDALGHVPHASEDAAMNADNRIKAYGASPRACRYLPGDQPDAWAPGDLILTHNPTGAFGKLIRFGQRLWYRGEDSPFAWFNHVGVIVEPGADGQPRMVEALNRGVVITDPRRIAPQWFAYIDTGMSDRDRAQVVGYAERGAQLHTAYGWLQIVSIAVALLTRGRLQLSLAGQNICSGFAAQGLRGGGMWWERRGQMVSASHLMPADLAASFHTERIRDAVLDAA